MERSASLHSGICEIASRTILVSSYTHVLNFAFTGTCLYRTGAFLTAK